MPIFSLFNTTAVTEKEKEKKKAAVPLSQTTFVQQPEKAGLLVQLYSCVYLKLDISFRYQEKKSPSKYAVSIEIFDHHWDQMIQNQPICIPACFQDSATIMSCVYLVYLLGFDDSETSVPATSQIPENQVFDTKGTREDGEDSMLVNSIMHQEVQLWDLVSTESKLAIPDLPLRSHQVLVEKRLQPGTIMDYTHDKKTPFD
ncbi:hypothetical protein K435DRAFT_809354 [Dendrothele bispora CBS 962.96]|uniref:Uncharacterized protein n=1 Tax=Dendrothele bispora (strain CBS 962.96) TaxID=1314807 RepID=A0A4S8KYI8_DENBC|nr:hypothetical protein K435DRAFT_809354 [Dendrothele bispora CBS 962.96]